jgi:beta-lactamase regulating signal transducer with metallopeptidase domain
MLLHSLWQVALLTIVAWVIERLWRKKSVEWSYVLHAGALVAGIVALPVTYAMVQIPNPTAVAAKSTARLADSQTAVRSVSPLLPSRAFEAQSPRRDLETTSVPASDTASSRRLQVWLRVAPWLVGIYFAGVALMLFRLAGSIIRTERLRALAKPIAEGALVHSLRVLSRKWSMGVVPVLAQADGILVPKVFGLFKPTILLPASAITGLSTSELEMIVAHELAHVRRYDTWVNLLQRLAEAVLFFNPALWLLSRRIGSLREYCCDELTCREMAAADAEPRVRYATALLKAVELAQPRVVGAGNLTALAATGRSPSELRRRVARLFGEPLYEPVRLSRGGVLLLAAVAFVIAGSPAMWPSEAQTIDKKVTTERSQATSVHATRKFSFGSKVELLALGTHDQDPQRWWDARGKPIEAVPFTWTKDGSVSSEDKIWRRIVFRIHELPEGAGVRWDVVGARASAGSRIGLDEEPHPKGYFGRYFGVADNQQTVNLRVGVAVGPWENVFEMEASGPNAFGRKGNKGIVSSGALDTAEGTVLVVSHNYFDPNFRVVAVDKQGKTHDSVYSGGTSAGQIYQTRPTFPGLKPHEIDHFEFQVRDYEWIELRGLPLNPGDGGVRERESNGTN